MNKLNIEKLTAKELEVFLLILKAMSNPKIAINLQTTEAAIKNRKYRIFKKLKVYSSQEIILRSLMK